jgi:putative DNA-invertase from lambdoid prophage Rac
MIASEPTPRDAAVPVAAGRVNVKDSAAYLGRKPSYSRRQFTVVRHILGHDAVGIARIAKETRLSRQTMCCIKDSPGAVEKRLP